MKLPFAAAIAATLVTTSVHALDDASYPVVPSLSTASRAEVTAAITAVDTVSATTLRGEVQWPNPDYVQTPHSPWHRVDVTKPEVAGPWATGI
jgi:hypothetical protein